MREGFRGSQGSLRAVDEAVFVTSKWSMTETVGELEGVQFPSGVLGYVVGVVYQTRDEKTIGRRWNISGQTLRACRSQFPQMGGWAEHK